MAASSLFRKRNPTPLEKNLVLREKNNSVIGYPMRGNILIIYHCSANTGYAIETLERVFWEMALNLVEGRESRISIAYPAYPEGLPAYTPEYFQKFYTFDRQENSRARLKDFAKYIRLNNIELIFGFDMPPRLPFYRVARKAGVQRIVSYWGAPMSSVNYGLKLMLKKLEVSLYRHSPDFYIFESQAIKDTAVRGRGIPAQRTAVCPTGVDTEKFKPDFVDRFYAHDLFGLPRKQKLVLYSGHFEQRKGVEVIIQAANLLCEERDDLTFVLFGNKNGEEALYAKGFNHLSAEKVIFGGYRRDLHRIQRSCYLGVIPSTGWDSFPMSALEMQASGLPLLASALQGLPETISEGETGFLFPPGDYRRLAKLISHLADFPEKQRELSVNARGYAEKMFGIRSQISRIAELVRTCK